jgi:propionate CoA-transferase
VKKFLDQVEHVTFSGKYAKMKKQPVLYVTERCVFSLTQEGMELIEIAPGVDLEKEILPLMDFEPIIKAAPRVMDEGIFKLEPMGLKDKLLAA